MIKKESKSYKSCASMLMACRVRVQTGSTIHSIESLSQKMEEDPNSIREKYLVLCVTKNMGPIGTEGL